MIGIDKLTLHLLQKKYDDYKQYYLYPKSGSQQIAARNITPYSYWPENLEENTELNLVDWILDKVWNIDKLGSVITCILTIDEQETLFRQYLLLKFCHRQ